MTVSRFSNQSSISGHLDCVQYLAVTNDASIFTFVCVCFHIVEQISSELVSGKISLEKEVRLVEYF